MGFWNALERLARRLWRGRWNAVAHADFLRYCSWQAPVGVGILAMLGLGLAGWAWWLKGLGLASAAARGMLALAWLLAVVINSGRVSELFALDDRREVTEAWLLTSEHRDTLLWARLAGLSAGGPLLLIALAPLYLLAVLGMPGGFYPLFVCGHFARAGCAFGGLEPEAVSWIAALPVAAAALLADVVAAVLAGAGSLSGALYQAAARRVSPLPFVGLFRHWGLFLDSVAMGLLLLLAEGGFALAAGLWLWAAKTWQLSPAPDVILGTAAACTVAGALMAVRLKLVAINVRAAAGRYDAALIGDGPD